MHFFIFIFTFILIFFFYPLQNLPRRVLSKIFPYKVNTSGQSLLGATHKESTVLSAYNGSSIPQHGSIYIQCTNKEEGKTLVTSEGPTKLGLPSHRDLKLVTVHCIMQENQAQINSAEDMRNVTGSDRTHRQFHR